MLRHTVYALTKYVQRSHFTLTLTLTLTHNQFNVEAPLGVFRIRDIRGKNYRDTGYLRKKLLGYRILRSSFRDTGYSQKFVTYQTFDEKRSRITKYMPFSVFLLICFIMLTGHTRLPLAKLLFIFGLKAS